MGAQPTTLASNLVAATQSTDHTAPTAVITSPASGASIGNGGATTVQGTASDAGGGVVAGVEVSLDGGSTWHPATGTTSWTYTGSMSGTGSEPIKARAVDDSGNLQTDGGLGQRLGVVPVLDVRPDHEPGPSGHPGHGLDAGSDGDRGGHQVPHRRQRLHHRRPLLQGHRQHRHPHRQPVELHRSAAGQGDLHQRVRQRLAGGRLRHARWRSPPAPPTSCRTTRPAGHYASSEAYFKVSGSAQGPIRALADGADGPNGVYSYGGDAFPTSTFDATNYYVDALFTAGSPADTTPPTVTAATPVNGTSSVATVGRPRPPTFSEPVQPATVIVQGDRLGRQHRRRHDDLQLRPPTPPRSRRRPPWPPGPRSPWWSAGPRTWPATP